MSLVELVRDWVGDAVDEHRILDALDRHVDRPHQVEWASLSILRRTLADIDAGPASMDVKDDVSWSTRGDQADGIRARIGRLERIVGDDVPTGHVLTSTPIVGPPTGR